MKTKIALMSAAAVVLAIALSAGSVLAREAGARPRHRADRQPGPVMERRAERLELGEMQRQRVRELFEAGREKARAAGTREERLDAMRETRKRIRDVLTENQQQTLDKLREAARERRQDRVQQRGQRLGDRLGLDEMQRQRIRELRDGARERMRAADTREQRRDEMRNARQRIRGTLTEGQQQKLEGLHRQIRARGEPGARTRVQRRQDRRRRGCN